MSAALPLAMMFQSALASAVYLHYGDWRHALYWAAAAVITFSVTV